MLNQFRNPETASCQTRYMAYHVRNVPKNAKCPLTSRYWVDFIRSELLVLQSKSLMKKSNGLYKLAQI